MSQKIIKVIGRNLFALAATYLQDATQWVRIAQANNISDPMLVGSTILIIPEVDTTAGGGVVK